MEPLRVFIGYDRQEPVSFHAAAHGIHRHSSVPVTVAPLMLSQLAGVFTRPRDSKQATDFSFSRFLVPYLCDYRGWALFLDSDVLVRRDLAELWKLRDDRYAVQVVQHDHRPPEGTKFLGHAQTSYPRKNWSSVMLFHADRCRALTPDYVNSASGLELHRFRWLADEEVGPLPAEWNHLVDYDPHRPIDALACLHYTSGGPWFTDYRGCGYAAAWWEELKAASFPISEQGCLIVPGETPKLKLHRDAA